MVFNASHNKQHIDIRIDALVIDMSELEIIDTTKGARLIPAGSEADTPVFLPGAKGGSGTSEKCFASGSE